MYITHDGRKTGKSNLKLEQRGPIEVLVSYWTPIAFRDSTWCEGNQKWFYTSAKFSPTTSKQLTIFLNAKAGGHENCIEVAQSHIEDAYKQFDEDNVQVNNRCLISEYNKDAYRRLG